MKNVKSDHYQPNALLTAHLTCPPRPSSQQITKQQSHIDRLYVSLKDMVEHRKTKLEQQYWMYQLNKEVEELEKWITERESVASSTELGHDLEDVTVGVREDNVISKSKSKSSLLHP